MGRITRRKLRGLTGKETAAGFELWGCLECTLNRVGDTYLDQCRLTGHTERSTDLQLFADLGITALRYPVLWELTAPRGPATADWSWRMAERYPWVEDFTPVNEPLTTARFSGLYGHRYPHGRDDRTFTRALLT